MSRIKEIKARQLVDCKCRPLVEVVVITVRGALCRGAAPTGSSVGKFEAAVLRDGDPGEYHGMSVHKAVNNVTEIIAPVLTGTEVSDQEKIDRTMIELDGTGSKSRLGGNAVYSVSVAVLRAAAAEAGMPLANYIKGGRINTVPVPSFNVINGGRYEELVQPFNEFIIMPYGAESIYRACEMGIDIYRELDEVLTARLGHRPKVAPSYGYQAPSEDPETVLELISTAVDNCGCTGKVGFAVDCASSEMYDKETDTYLLKGKRVSAEVLIYFAKGLTGKFNFVFIEDLLDEEAWEDYPKAKKALTRTNVIGDDFTVTSPARIRRAYETDALDGFILKPNQIGTITEAMEAYRYATERNWLAITSGRAGGVIGDVVMDMAVGLEIGFIKNGAPRSGERIDKLNFLMRTADTNPGCRMADISPLLKFR